MTQPLKFAFIVGSHRGDSQSSRIAHWIAGRLPALATGATQYTLDIGKTPLPLWDEGVWQNEPRWTSLWGPIAKELQSADALIALSPEWSGMVPAGLKNFFLLASSKELGHKPGLIVAVSASRGGAYPVAELRMSSYKNTAINWIPDHVIVRDAPKMLVGETPADKDDAYIRGRLDYGVKVLAEYAMALRAVRSSGVINTKDYPYGM